MLWVDGVDGGLLLMTVTDGGCYFGFTVWQRKRHNKEQSCGGYTSLCLRRFVSTPAIGWMKNLFGCP